MSRIQQKFDELNSRNEKALIAYVMAGHPTKNDTISIIRGLIKGGADIVEIGFPFSDPLADGPVIQNAGMESLKKGTNLKKYAELITQIRKETEIPLILMTYSNIIYNQGYGKFAKLAKSIGIDGLILPDMSIEESKDYISSARKTSLDTIFLVSPNTQKDRIINIAKSSSGFVYVVTIYGTTGVKTVASDYSIKAIHNVKKIVNGTIPVGVGFGVSSPKDVRKYVAAGADAVIVGSAFLRLINKTTPGELENKIAEFTKKLKKETKLS